MGIKNNKKKSPRMISHLRRSDNAACSERRIQIPDQGGVVLMQTADNAGAVEIGKRRSLLRMSTTRGDTKKDGCCSTDGGHSRSVGQECDAE